MTKIRIVGSPKRNNTVNSTHQQMVGWMLRFNGCMFTEEDWAHFIESAKKFAQKLNGRLLGGIPSPNRIDITIDDSQIRVDYHNTNTAAGGLELLMDVIEIKSEYSRSMGVPEPYLPFKTGSDDSSEEGGER